SVNLAGANTTLLGTYFAKHIQFGKQNFVTGVQTTHPWWKVQGEWPDDGSQSILLGERLAARIARHPGDQVEIAGQGHAISGILSTGGAEDDQIVAPLSLAQEIIGRPGAVRRIYVSALTKPEDAFARRDPASLRAQEGNRIDESARRRRLPSLRIIFCRGHAVSADQRPGRISRWRIAGEANWPLHFRFSDYDRAGAAADYSRHRYRSHVCGQHVG